MRRLSNTDENRFWSRVKKSDGCWIFNGAPSHKYPKFFLKGVEIKAHRVSYFIRNGSIKHGNVVMHTCDNPRCVNPLHLKQGTQKENLLDMRMKGRGSKPPNFKGSSSPRSKIKETDVQTIRELYKEGMKISDIEKKLDGKITWKQVQNIALRKQWVHLQ